MVDVTPDPATVVRSDRRSGAMGGDASEERLVDETLGIAALADIAAELRRARAELVGDRDLASAREWAVSSSSRIVADAWERAERLIAQTEADVESVWAQVHAAVDDHVSRAGAEVEEARAEAERLRREAEQALSQAEEVLTRADRLRLEASRLRAEAAEALQQTERRASAQVQREVVRALTSVQAQVIRAFAEAAAWTGSLEVPQDPSEQPGAPDGRPDFTTPLLRGGGGPVVIGQVWIGPRPPLPPVMPLAVVREAVPAPTGGRGHNAG